MPAAIAKVNPVLPQAHDDDVTLANGDVSFNTTELLANDQGGAAKHVTSVNLQGLNDVLDYNASTGVFTLDANYHPDEGGVDGDITYTIQLANGAYSTATVHVHIDTHLGDELLSNWTFNDPTVPDGGYSAQGSIAGWTTLPGSAGLEVVDNGYFGVGGDGQWLDTQGSNGPIHISQTVDIAAGAHAQLSISLSVEDLVSLGLSTNSAEHLIISVNGVPVGDISRADFTDTNTFHTFTYDVTGVAGTETIEIESTGVSTNVGFALDSVSLKEWIV